jgi:hypothetical protein
MSKDKPSGSGDREHDDRSVGYCKPPFHTQFKPGQTGNPAGRPKGVRNLKSDVQRTLATPVKVKEGGRIRKKSTQESALMVLREKALSGDSRALDRFLELAGRFNNDVAENEFQELIADDQAILDAYVAEVTGSKQIMTEINSPDEIKEEPQPSRKSRRR